MLLFSRIPFVFLRFQTYDSQMFCETWAMSVSIYGHSNAINTWVKTKNVCQMSRAQKLQPEIWKGKFPNGGFSFVIFCQWWSLRKTARLTYFPNLSPLQNINSKITFCVEFAQIFRKVFDRIVLDRSLNRRRIVIYRKLDGDEEFAMNVNKMMILCLVVIKI